MNFSEYLAILGLHKVKVQFLSCNYWCSPFSWVASWCFKMDTQKTGEKTGTQIPPFSVLCHIYDICDLADSGLFHSPALSHAVSECLSYISPPGWEVHGLWGCSLLDASYILRHKQLQSKPCPRTPADVNKLYKTVPQQGAGGGSGDKKGP